MVPIANKDTEGGGGLETNLRINHIYLFKEKRTHIGYQKLKELIEKGYEGLCITREYPPKVKERYSLDKCQFLWLTQNKVPDLDTLAPNEIGRLSSMLNKYISNDDNAKRAFLLDHLEYLINQNNFETILRVIHIIKDRVMLHPVIFLLPIDPKTLDFKEVRLLERECEVIDTEDH